jgi:prophage antirepressor-like protein
MPTAQVVPFHFESHEVRTLIIDGNPWFIAKDVCDVLSIVNYRDALSRVLENHKGVASTDTLGGVQKMAVIDEPGLYRLILRSDKPQAEPFMEWVTAEVLPAIHKTGSYQQPKNKPESLAKLSREYHAALRMAKSNGLKGRQAMLAANRCTEAQTGFSPLDLLGIDPEDLPDQELCGPKKMISEPLAGRVSEYLDMLKEEWRAGRTQVQFTEKDNGRLETVITMRELFTEFQDIARRRSVPQYRSTMQLALRCSTERGLLENAGWIFSKTVKINGIQRWLLVRLNNDKGGYFSETLPSFCSEEKNGKYQAASITQVWN